MAGRFVNPFPQFLNSTPTVLSGAKLFFYAAGTATKQNTYSDRTLSTPNTNPVVLNSSGYSSTDIYLQDLDYKVVLAPSTDTDPPTSPIWSADYVRGRDSALIAKTLTGSGSPSGAVAGTAGSASILPDFYWDYTNSILYVCTTTGTSSTAVWTAVNATAATTSTPPPQGRLTPTSATPVITADATSATAIYYTPYVGNLVPIYNGSSMTPTAFSELTLTLVSSHALNTIYDVFAFSNSGVVTLVTGPAWNNSTAGSCTRGTGASTTQLTRVNGLLVNAVLMTARNGSTTYSVGANLATYVGSILIDGTAGQVTCHTSYGQLRNFGVWNAYNRVPIILKCGDATASWTYATNGYRLANNSASNTLKIFSGLAEEDHDISYANTISAAVTTTNSFIPNISVGLNGSTVGKSGTFTFSNQTAITLTYNVALRAEYIYPPALGINTIGAYESNGGGVTNTMSGTETNMLLIARWRG